MRNFRSVLLLLILLASCQNKGQDKKSTYFEIRSENASLIAQKIMSDNFYWDLSDEFSPFGNDAGHDTFYIYRDWKQINPNKTGIEFLLDDLKEINSSNFDLNITDNGAVQKHVYNMPNKYVDLNRIDNEIISLAFTQLFLHGKIEDKIKNLSLKAIEREMLYLDFWDNDANIREERLVKMKGAIMSSN